MVSGIGDVIGDLFNLLFVLCVIFVPLGMWKLIELIIIAIQWIFR